MPVYFHLWELQSPEAVIIHLLLKQWQDSSERSRGRRGFKEHRKRLKGRVAELEKKLHDSRNGVNRVTAELEKSEPEINRLMKRVQELQLQNEKLQCAHNEICVRQSGWWYTHIEIDWVKYHARSTIHARCIARALMHGHSSTSTITVYAITHQSMNMHCTTLCSSLWEKGPKCITPKNKKKAL